MLHHLSLPIRIKDGEDFTSATQLLALHIGSSEGTQQCGGFDITDDAIQEMQETFTVSLTVADLAVQISSGGDRTTILITDDDGKFLFWNDNIAWLAVPPPICICIMVGEVHDLR